MKLPEYTLKKPVTVYLDGPMGEPTEFPPGTLIHPFWNETFLPDHIKERFKKPPKRSGSLEIPGDKEEKMIVCQVGRQWIEVPASSIRRSGW